MLKSAATRLGNRLLSYMVGRALGVILRCEGFSIPKSIGSFYSINGAAGARRRAQDAKKTQLGTSLQIWSASGPNSVLSDGCYLVALAYAQTYPDYVTEMVLRGIFLIRKEECDWFHNGGCARFHPELWEQFIAPIPEAERGNMLEAYHKRLFGDDSHVRLNCARAWSRWEGATVTMVPSPQRAHAFARDDYALAFARIEAHYFINGGFMEEDGQLLRDVHKISHIPGIIVQGRYDVVTPPISAWQLHKAWPKSKLVVAPDAGHAVSEPSITTALLDATDHYRAS